MSKPKGHVERWRRALVLIDELQELLQEDFLYSMNGFLDEGAEEADKIDKALTSEYPEEYDHDAWICRAAGCFLVAKDEITEQLKAAEAKFQGTNL